MLLCLVLICSFQNDVYMSVDGSLLLGIISRSMDPIAFAKGRDMASDTAMILNEDKHFMSCSMPREHHKFFEAPVSNMRALHVHNNDDPSTSEGSSSRGRMLTEDIFGPRTRSPSPGRKAHTFAVNNVHSKEFGFSPRSPLKMSEGLRSPPHPLPLPPAPGACSPLPPSPTACSPLPPSPTPCSPLPTSPTACSQSQSQWKKGKLLGSGTFGQVYLGFNRYHGFFMCSHHLRFCYHLELNALLCYYTLQNI
jgi:mitogen-activated protein kinase kinase kinase 3